MIATEATTLILFLGALIGVGACLLFKALFRRGREPISRLRQWRKLRSQHREVLRYFDSEDD